MAEKDPSGSVRRRLSLALVCLLTIGTDRQPNAFKTSPPAGAWLQTDLKWNTAPVSVSPQLQYSQATILYFGDDQKFAILMCVVNRVPGEYTTISHGDGLALYRGQWMADRKGIAIWYQFVPRPPRQWPEPSIAGQSIQHAIVHRSHDQLTFAGMNFNREPKLDDDAREAMLTTSDIMERTPLR